MILHTKTGRILLLTGVLAVSMIAACAPRTAPRAPETTGEATGTATLRITLPAVSTLTTTATVPDTVPSSRPLHSPPSRQMLLDSGAVYFQACAICHGKNGRGGRGPAVANSDYVQGDRTRLIHTVLDGIQEPILINGVRWKTGEMLGWRDTWDDFKIAAVLTYITVALNDSTVTDCIPENFETGTWASCTLAKRDSTDIARDSVAVSEVVEVRRK